MIYRQFLETVQFFRSRTFFFEERKKPGDRGHLGVLFNYLFIIIIIIFFFFYGSLCERHFTGFLIVLGLVLGLTIKVFSQRNGCGFN